MMKRKNQILAVLLSASMIVGTLVQAVPVQAETQLSTYGNIANQANITCTGTAGSPSNLVDNNDGTLYNFLGRPMGPDENNIISEQTITLTYDEARRVDACRIAFENVGNTDNVDFLFTYSILAKNSGDEAYDTIANRATANRTDNSAQEYKFNEKTYSEIKIVMHSCTTYSGNSYGWPAVAEFEVYGSSRDVDPSAMSVYAENEVVYDDKEGKAEYVLDGNINSIWHTNWSGSERNTHYLIFTFNESAKIDGMRFLQRQGSSPNGRVTKFDLYTKEKENDSWTLIIDDGALLTDNTLWQKVDFDKTVTAKQVMFQVVDAESDQQVEFASAAEIRFTQVDYSGINAAIVAASEKVEANYTGNSWTALQNALTAANKAKVSATQAQIDAATATLNAAISNLAARANFTDLNNAIQAAEAKRLEDDFNNYTDASVNNLNTKLDQAKAMAADTNAAQEEVTAMAQAVRTAINELEVDEAKVAAKELAAAKAALNTAISTANERLSSEDIVNYTDESVEGLSTALSTAQAVAAREDATKTDVDNAKAALEKAVTGLTLKDADYTAVEEAKKAAKAVDRSDKTDESLAVLDNAVKAVVEGKKITEQADVDAMAQAIMTAITELKIDEAKVAAKELAAAKAALSAMITETQNFITTNSKYDCRALEALVKEAQELVALETADVNSVNAKAVELTVAMDNFEYFYMIKVNGVIVATGAYNTRVTINAPVAEDGMKFVGWKVNEKIISTKEVYTFSIANSMDITSEFIAEEDAAVEISPSANMANTLLIKRADGKANARFVAQLIVPEGYTLMETGLLWCTKDTPDTLHGENGAVPTGVKKLVSPTVNINYQFSSTINGMPVGKFVRGMIYAKVKNNATGAVTWVYSGEEKIAY